MTTGPALVEVRIGDAPGAWTDAGFVVDGSRIQLGPLTVVCSADGTAPVLGFDGPVDLDGVPSVVVGSGAPAARPEAERHPNGIDGFDHVVVMAPHLERVRQAVLAAGLEIRRERSARLGDSDITQLFVWAGSVLLEIVAPAGGDDPGGASQVWGLAATASDLDATAQWFGDRIGRPRAAVQAGRRIATIRHRDLGIGLQLAVMSAR